MGLDEQNSRTLEVRRRLLIDFESTRISSSATFKHTSGHNLIPPSLVSSPFEVDISGRRDRTTTVPWSRQMSESAFWSLRRENGWPE